MLFDSIQIVEGGQVYNLTVATGSTFPLTPSYGELFYHMDDKKLYLFTGTIWDAIGTDSILATVAATGSYLDLSNVPDVAGHNTGDQTIVLSGDISGTGQGPISTTLATVNASPQTDTFSKITVNAKGLVTATSAVTAADVEASLGFVPYNSTNPASYITATASISGNAATASVAPAGSLTGNALASNVVSSSLTSVGTLSSLNVTGASHLTGTLTMTGDIMPSANVTYNMGSPTMQWHSVYVGPGTLYVNGKPVIEDNSGTITVGTSPGQNLMFQTTGGGILQLDGGGANGGYVSIRSPLQVTAGNNLTSSDGNPIQFANTIGVDGLIAHTANATLTINRNGTGVVQVNSPLTVTGATTQQAPLTITSNAVTTTTSTGALIVSGGAGIGGTVVAGSILNTPISGSTGAFTTLGTSGVVTITDSTQATGANTGALKITGGASIGGNTYISGNLTIVGSLTTASSSVITVTDPMLYLGSGNATDVVDLGFIAAYTPAGFERHTGVIRDASDGVFKFFDSVASEPSSVVDFSTAVYSPVKMGALTATTGTFSGAVSGTTFTGATSGTHTGAVIGNVTGNVSGTAATITGTYAGSITSAQVTSGLGFTPYNATNPSGYISGISSSTVTTALGFTPYNATNPSGWTSNTGTVTSVSGAGTVSGLTLTGTVSTTGSLTLGGTLSLTSANVTNALGFTPYNATNPSGYVTSSVTLTTASQGNITTVGTLTNVTTSGSYLRSAAGTGFLNGNYPSVESTTTSGAIYTIGGSYVPGSTTLGNMYGVGYTYSGAAGNPGGVGASKWGMYVASGGIARIFLNSDDGAGHFSGVMNASQFNGSGAGLTGTAASLTAGAATTASSATTAGSVTHSYNRTDSASYPILWGVAGATTQMYSAGAVTITSSTGAVNATVFNGSGAGLTGTAASLTAGGASSLQGYTLGTQANGIVQRDGNGYIANSYFYTSGGGAERSASGMGYFSGHNSSDYYIRSYTAQAAATALSGTTMNINGSSTSCSGNAASASTAAACSGNAATASAASSVSSTNAQMNGSDGWWRSTGAAGWYSTSYAVGIYSTGTGLVQTYNNSSFQVNGTMYATGNVAAYYSDMRLKTKTGNIENALDKVSKLNGFYYTINDKARSFGFDDESVHIGVSAQEVQTVVPEAVKPAPFDISRDEETMGQSKSGEDYITVQYERLVPLLIEAIKELKLQNEGLRADIETLKATK
jgi:hypothetical protein